VRYRSLIIWVYCGFLVFGFVMVAPLFWPREIIFPMLTVTGVVMLIGGLIGLGMSVMLSRSVSCPHCQRGCDLWIDFWTGRPRLKTYMKVPGESHPEDDVHFDTESR
jgi:hypothetical protein